MVRAGNGSRSARALALVAAAVGDTVVAAVLAAGRCRVERTYDDSVWYTVRFATQPAAFALVIREKSEPAFEQRLRRYGGELFEDVKRVVLVPVLETEPGWQWDLMERHFRRGSEPTDDSDADRLSRLLRLTGGASRTAASTTFEDT